MLLSITSRTDSYLQFITVLLLFVFVLAITYWTTRFIANYQRGKTGKGNMEVVETLKLTTNKYLQIVRAGEKYLLIAIGKDEIHMLTELSKEELVLLTDPVTGQKNFAQIFDRVKKLKDNEKKDEAS